MTAPAKFAFPARPFWKAGLSKKPASVTAGPATGPVAVAATGAAVVVIGVAVATGVAGVIGGLAAAATGAVGVIGVAAATGGNQVNLRSAKAKLLRSKRAKMKR